MPEKRPVVLVYVKSSILYNILLPVGAVIVIVLAAKEQVGCVIVTMGDEGVGGCALTVTLVLAEIQPALLFAVKLYVPAGIAVKIPVVLV